MSFRQKVPQEDPIPLFFAPRPVWPIAQSAKNNFIPEDPIPLRQHSKHAVHFIACNKSDRLPYDLNWQFNSRVK